MAISAVLGVFEYLLYIGGVRVNFKDEATMSNSQSSRSIPLLLAPLISATAKPDGSTKSR
jgi:hypothetical protein